jgi:RimJ/RimL family protein N-acetyltransferase
VRFDIEGREATISISLDPAQRGKSLGTLLIWAACRKLVRESNVERIIAFIKPDNVASVRAFEKAGFVKAGETTIHGQRALRFEFEPQMNAD